MIINWFISQICEHPERGRIQIRKEHICKACTRYHSCYTYNLSNRPVIPSVYSEVSNDLLQETSRKLFISVILPITRGKGPSHSFQYY